VTRRAQEAANRVVPQYNRVLQPVHLKSFLASTSSLSLLQTEQTSFRLDIEFLGLRELEQGW
jgi:hypothetical protein